MFNVRPLRPRLRWLPGLPRFPIDPNPLRVLHVARRHKRGPGFPGFRFVIRRFPRHRRNTNQHVAFRTLNLPARKLLVALEVLFALRTGEFEFGHKSQIKVHRHTALIRLEKQTGFRCSGPRSAARPGPQRVGREDRRGSSQSNRFRCGPGPAALRACTE